MDDDAKSALMVEFYRNLWVRKLGKADALRSAQLSVLRGESFRPPGAKKGEAVSPYFWAAFSLAGDWR